MRNLARTVDDEVFTMGRTQGRPRATMRNLARTVDDEGGGVSRRGRAQDRPKAVMRNLRPPRDGDYR